MADVPNLDLDATDGTEAFAKAIEQMAEQDKLAAEAAERRKQAARELRDLYGDFAGAIDKASKRNADLMRSMRDGTFSRQAREMAELNRQYEKLRREAELTARFGNRAGGFLARHEKALGVAGRAGSFAAGATLATGAGLVRQGFSGTVESVKLERETKMLAREFASVMKPLIDVTTRGVRSLRQFMEGLGTTGQNLMAVAGTALMASAALRLVGAGGLVSAGAQALVAGGVSIGTQAAISAGGGAVGGAAGGAAAGAAASRFGAIARGAGRVAKAVPYAGAVVAGVDAAVGGDYGRFRESGSGAVPSYLMAFGASLYDGYHMLAPWESGPNPMDKARRDWDQKRGRGDHRSVSVAGGGWDSIGAGFERLNSAISMAEPESAPKEAPAKVSDEWGEGVLAELGRAAADMKAAAADMKAAADRRDGPALKRPGE